MSLSIILTFTLFDAKKRSANAGIERPVASNRGQQSRKEKA
jgi:hypothetical protein